MKMRSFFLPITLSCLISISYSATKYVATNGNDNNAGTINSPYLTITKAISAVNAGDTIIVRGGVYTLTTTITISKNGTSTHHYHLFAYQGERPVLDFSGMAMSSSNYGIKLSGS